MPGTAEEPALRPVLLAVPAGPASRNSSSGRNGSPANFTDLILLYTLELVINDVCTYFKILGQVVLEKTFTKISIFIIYIGVRDINQSRTNGPTNAHLTIAQV